MGRFVCMYRWAIRGEKAKGSNMLLAGVVGGIVLRQEKVCSDLGLRSQLLDSKESSKKSRVLCALLSRGCGSDALHVAEGTVLEGVVCDRR